MKTDIYDVKKELLNESIKEGLKSLKFNQIEFNDIFIVNSSAIGKVADMCNGRSQDYGKFLKKNAPKEFDSKKDYEDEFDGEYIAVELWDNKINDTGIIKIFDLENKNESYFVVRSDKY